MVRYSVKNNKAYFGWEAGFKKIDGSAIAVPLKADIGFILNMESISLSDLKPKRDRIQKWFVNNPSRKFSYTYDSEYKVGEGSLSGDFKNARVVDAVLGITSRNAQSTYDEVTFDGEGNSRKTFFGYFEHGSSRIKSLNGMLASELSIDATETEIVSFDLSVMVARMLDVTTALVFTPEEVAVMEDLTREPFHWKHVSVKLTDGDPSGTYDNLLMETGNSYQQVTQSAASTLSTVTGLGASTYNFKVNTISYAVTTLASNTYQQLIIQMNTNATPSLPSNFHFRLIEGILTCISADGTSVVLAVGDTADLFAAMTLHTGFDTAVDNVEGSEFESAKLAIRNNSEMKFGAPSTGGQQWASWYREMGFEVDMEFTLFPDTMDTILWDLGPEETKYVDYNTILVNSELGAEILFQRDTNDFVRFRLAKAEVDSCSENLSAIDSGVDPVQLVLKFAEQDSTLSAYAEDPLQHTESAFSA